VINQYFTDEKKAIEQLEADLDGIGRQIEEMEEEHSGEEGLLEEVRSEARSVKAMCKSVSK